MQKKLAARAWTSQIEPDRARLSQTEPDQARPSDLGRFPAISGASPSLVSPRTALAICRRRRGHS
eukprot:scaffold79442_cov66-Phaeocystis_antarctica.AAC.5